MFTGIRHKAVLVLGLVLVAVMVACGGTPQQTPVPPLIAFLSLRDGNSEIYVMTVDGSGQTRLTNNDGTDANPSWSP